MRAIWGGECQHLHEEDEVMGNKEVVRSPLFILFDFPKIVTRANHESEEMK
jgi:hypothetical protein